MSGRLPITLSFFIFVLMINEFGFCCGNPNPICRKDEKQALLCFKKGLKDPSSRLWSWVDGDYDCCTKWAGVVCNNVTGHVTALHLANPAPGNGSSAFGGELSRCLLELKQLSHLDLSGNDFEGIPIPSFLGSLLNLEYLNLSEAGFQGIIPHQLGNLTGLHTLNIRGSAYSSPVSSGFLEISLGKRTTSLSDAWNSLGGLKVDSLEWLSSLSNLQRLDLSYVDLSNVLNWVEVTSALPSLHHLHFSGCSLANISSSLHHHNNYSSLLVLHLSQNSFNCFVPKWVFNLHSLVSLDLSHSSFLGPLPETGPWNFSSLETLDISLNHLSGPLPSHGNLPKLKILRTTHNMFNSSLPQWIFRCSELQTLDLHGNSFSGPVHVSVGKMKRLRYLDLNGNDFRSSIPSWIYECTELSYLDLGYNRFQGTISNSISNLTSLAFFSVSNNKMLSGEVPKQIGKLCKLVSLSLSANKFSGLISELFQSMSECVFDCLVKLLLYNNQFSGPMFDTSLKFPSLSTLDLGGNKMNGTLPEGLGNMFPMLDFLDVSNNILEGVVTENHFVNLKELWSFYASGNRLTLNVSPNWLPPFKLSKLGLGSWHLGPQFPVWLQSLKQISEVDISNAGIKDEVPTWLWNLSSQLSVLNLSHNQFSGPLPQNTFAITKLDLSNNFFSGDIVGFFCHPQNKSFELNRLHLRRNALSGQIPDCLGNWSALEVLDLAENSLSGRIPKSIGLLNSLLSSLDLNGNKLSGNIPSSLENCTSLMKLDLGENELEGNTANWLMSSLSRLIVLRLRSNRFYGELSPDFCHLTSLQILDLADNNFTGIIPKCLNNFTSMVEQNEIDIPDIDRGTEILDGESATVTTKGLEYQYFTIILVLFTSFDLSNNNFSGEIPVELTTLLELRSLNLSGNKLTGNIPKKIGDMKQLESIDLSRNHLSGEIPYSLSNLNFLSYLNLSYNNLSGKIPTGTQLQSFNASCYVGNNLCGPPLIECSNDDDDVPDEEEEEDRGDDSETKWFYISMAIGFVVGWWGIWGPLFLVKSWRQAYFQFLDVKLKYLFRWFGL